ncbi:MAG TPA: DUF523 domain-containing protein [Mobilitalea sp.]|nr:DUF523 domain-containing protein [Mobilitalea sp.]
MNILVSACLLGVNCRYDGSSTLIKNLDLLMERYHLIPICPEILGGLTIPRQPAEIVAGRVIYRSGEDVTEPFQRGAYEVLKLAKLYACKHAILKERSPSCGHDEIYDGTFSHTIVEGNGVLAELLASEGITVLGESQIENLL